MKKINYLKLTAASIAAMLIIIASCTDEVSDRHKTAQLNDRTITLRAAMPQDNPSTRIALEGREGTLNLTVKWEEGDVIQLFYVQDETIAEGNESTVFNISEDGKTSSFNITVPEEIDVNLPFNLYAFCGIPEQGVQLIDGEILADITPVKSTTFDEFSVPVWTKAENILLLTADIELEFSHLGAYEVIHLKNESSQNIEVSDLFLVPEDLNSQLWYHDGNDENTPVFNPVSGDFTTIQGESVSQTASDIVIESGTVKTIFSWYVPNGENIPKLSLKINETVSENSKDAKDFAMLPGRAYHIYAVWEGVKLNVTDDDFITDLPEIVLTTTRSNGSTISLNINAAEEDREEAWIDLNNNGIKEEGESIIFETDYDYTIQSQTVTVYGKVKSFDCSDNRLTSLNITKNEKLERLFCYNNQLTSLDLSKSEQLEFLSCFSNQLINLDLTKSERLSDLYCQSNQLTSINVSKNEQLITLWCANNKLTSLDVANNEQLNELWCSNNPITCIKVNQTQLENIPTNWLKSSAAVYSLTCD